MSGSSKAITPGKRAAGSPESFHPKKRFQRRNIDLNFPIFAGFPPSLHGLNVLGSKQNDDCQGKPGCNEKIPPSSGFIKTPTFERPPKTDFFCSENKRAQHVGLKKAKHWEVFFKKKPEDQIYFRNVSFDLFFCCVCACFLLFFLQLPCLGGLWRNPK